MKPEEKIERLEHEVKMLKEREKKLQENVKIFRQIFNHLNTQMEHMKKELLKRR